MVQWYWFDTIDPLHSFKHKLGCLLLMLVMGVVDVGMDVMYVRMMLTVYDA